MYYNKGEEPRFEKDWVWKVEWRPYKRQIGFTACWGWSQILIGLWFGQISIVLWENRVFKGKHEYVYLADQERYVRGAFVQ